MRRFTRTLPWLFVLALIAGCADERVSAPDSPRSGDETGLGADHEALALAMVSQAGWALDESLAADHETAQEQRLHWQAVEFIGREVVAGDVVHYAWHLRIGPGTYDKIGLHRVVRETRPWRPIRTSRSIFLQHGDYVGFATAFLPGSYSPNTPADFGVAVHLADADVDVWGIDQAWTLIPEGLADFSFMADWGLQREVDRLSAGIAIARLTRFLTGSGHGKVLLLGYSAGAFTGYALLNQETQLPAACRQVKGFIPVDSEMRTDWQELIDADRGYLEYLQYLYAGGQYQEDVIWRTVAFLARTEPDGESPFYPPLTNWQASLAMAAAPYGATSAHYLAGVWEGELPVGLRFTPTDRWLDFLATGVSYEPILSRIDFYSVECGVGDPPFDDHVGEIRVPILSVGAGGGFMPDTYMDELVASTDFTELVIQLEPADQAVIDIGHVDLFTADIAPELVWQPILEWIEAHSE